MKCEIIAVGTELLLGQIVDTNSSWMGEQLALAGIDSHFQVKVGDNLERMIFCIRQALERSDAVIVCGGLGPTQDDITRDAIAAVMGVPLVRDDEMGQKIRAGFESRGRRFAENNLRQADRPEGAEFIKEMPGTAPGLVCAIDGKVVFAVPGVPYEMREMVSGTVLPELTRRAGLRSVIRSRVLRSWGESESGLAEMLHDRIEALDLIGNPTLAFLASGIEGIKIRITAKTEDEASAMALLDEEEARIRAIVGDAIFGIDEVGMEAAVLQLLGERGLTLATAESLTGGMLGTRLTDVPGASAVYRGGVVAYASEVKFAQLDVPAGPVISAACAKAMAEGVRKKLGADVGLATTGVAGPDKQEGHPPGTVFVAMAMEGLTETRELKLTGDRRRIREYGVIGVLNLLRLRLMGSSREFIR